MTIVFLDAKTMGFGTQRDLFTPLGTYVEYDATMPAQIVERAEEAEIIITNKVMLDRQTLARLPNLRLICVTATGTNNVDRAYASEHNITVKNVVNYSSHSVAQHVFSMLLSYMHQVQAFDEFVKEGAYTRSGMFTHYIRPIYELKNKTFGIIGLGNIGKTVANIATAFGADVQYYSTSGKNHVKTYPRVSLGHLMETSDFISIHAPLNAQTENLIALDELKKMKKSAIILNLARGGIINEEALAKAIEADLIGGACVDVFSAEPLDKNHPLLQVSKKEKLVLSPHIAWTSVEARTLLMKRTVENIREFISTKAQGPAGA